VPISVGGQMAGQSRDAWLRRLKDLRSRHDFEHAAFDAATRAVALEGGFPRELVLDLLPCDGAPEPRSCAPRGVAPDDVAFVQFSSGSTSAPKGVIITHGNALANIRLICDHDGRSATSPIVSWVPLYHDMGLVGGLLSPMLSGNPLVLLHPACFLMRPASWLEALSAHRGEMTGCPNFALDMCTSRVRDRDLEKARVDLSSVRFVYNGAEPVSPATVQRFEERFARFGLRPGVVQPAYGMAEASLAVTARPPGAPLKLREVDGSAVVSVGRPLGDFQIRIADEEGHEVARGVTGEILVRGSSVSPGYHDDDEATRERFRDGWLCAGDLGFLDEDGDLFVTGRKKDLIIVNGRNFYGHDLAARLDDLPFLQRGQTHVFTLPAAAGGEQVVVMTVLDPLGRAALAKLQESFEGEAWAWMREQAGARASSWILEDASPAEIDALKDAIRRFLFEEFGLGIHDVMIVRRLPRTSSGKVRREECVNLYNETASGGSGSDR
jgi:acyl-CoA synthetase (AMP-forming)/AMP-acid ligase II